MKLRTKITMFSTIFMLVLIIAVHTIIYFMFYKISTENELEQLTNQTDTIVEAMKENPDIPKRNLLQAFLPSNGMIRMIDESEKEAISTLTKKEAYTKLPFKFSNHETEDIIKDENGNYVAVIYKPIIDED